MTEGMYGVLRIDLRLGPNRVPLAWAALCPRCHALPASVVCQLRGPQLFRVSYLLKVAQTQASARLRIAASQIVGRHRRFSSTITDAQPHAARAAFDRSSTMRRRPKTLPC